MYGSIIGGTDDSGMYGSINVGDFNEDSGNNGGDLHDNNGNNVGDVYGGDDHGDSGDNGGDVYDVSGSNGGDVSDDSGKMAVKLMIIAATVTLMMKAVTMSV